MRVPPRVDLRGTVGARAGDSSFSGARELFSRGGVRGGGHGVPLGRRRAVRARARDASRRARVCDSRDGVGVSGGMADDRRGVPRDRGRARERHRAAPAPLAGGDARAGLSRGVGERELREPAGRGRDVRGRARDLAGESGRGGVRDDAELRPMGRARGARRRRSRGEPAPRGRVPRPTQEEIRHVLGGVLQRPADRARALFRALLRVRIGRIESNSEMLVYVYVSDFFETDVHFLPLFILLHVFLIIDHLSDRGRVVRARPARHAEEVLKVVGHALGPLV